MALVTALFRVGARAGATRPPPFRTGAIVAGGRPEPACGTGGFFAGRGTVAAMATGATASASPMVASEQPHAARRNTMPRLRGARGNIGDILAESGPAQGCHS
jgi:hypothetical protein